MKGERWGKERIGRREEMKSVEGRRKKRGEVGRIGKRVNKK